MGGADGGGGGEGVGEGDGGDGGGEGDGVACAQTSHPVPSNQKLSSEDHVKALPSNTLLGPVVPLYVAPFTISLS